MYVQHLIIVSVPWNAVAEVMRDWRRLGQSNGSGYVVLPSMDAAEMEDGSRLEIPKDARLIGVNESFSSRAFAFCLEHDSFPGTQGGEMVPRGRLREWTLTAMPATQADECSPILVDATVLKNP